MIIVRIIGGLGNQLFQYAMGRNLAIKNNTLLKLDLTLYERYKLHAYSLDAFNIKAEIASAKEIRKYCPNKLTLKLHDLTNHQFSSLFVNRKFFKERHFHFDPNLLNAKEGYFLGYWQSEKYFYEIRDTLLKDLSLRNGLCEKSLDLTEKIKTTNAVSVHIRRADFETNALHGVCSVEYYQQAVDKITKGVVDPHFFIFSNDMQWAKKHLNIDAPHTFVFHNTSSRNFEDLILMSLCKHFIIANSTFSWWGAWLSENKEKKVLYPRNWFNDRSINTEDLFPNLWTKI